MTHCKKIPAPLIALLFYSCSLAGQTLPKEYTGIIDQANFGDTLYIKTTFTECGEFGGHTELLKVYLAGGEFYMTYQKFEADCTKIAENQGVPAQTLKKTFTGKLTEENNFAIEYYFEQLKDAAGNNYENMQVGYTFQVTKKDKSINFFVYTMDYEIRKEYLTLIEQLTG